MRILLAFPPMPGSERYGKLAGAGSYLPPLGLAYLAAAVEPQHEVRIFDGGAPGLGVDEFLRELSTFRPQLVGITALTSTLYRSLSLCRLVKEANPGTTTVLGGPHPTAAPLEVMEDPAVDVVAIGEGEQTLVELARCLEAAGDPAEVRGIAFRRDGQVRQTGRRDRIANLDALPLPARHLLPMSRYQPSVLHYKRSPALSIMCGRGCPFRCTFCSCAKVFAGKVTVRSPESVVAEVAHLVERYGAREIMFWDDIFGLSRRWTERLCELMAPMGLTWSAWIRADLVDADILAKMAHAGCWNLSYGVESGNQRVLDTIKKGFTLEQVRRAFRLTHEAGIEARGTFILGLPGDTWQSMMDTVALAIEIDADYAQFQLLTPYPGTELYERSAEHGTYTSHDLSRYTIWFPVYVPTGLSEADLLRAHALAYRRFYLRPRYVLGRLRSLQGREDVVRNAKGLSSLVRYFASGLREQLTRRRRAPS